MTWPQSVYFTPHALTRLEEHYPRCTHEDGWRLIADALELTPEGAVLRTLGRRGPPPGARPSRYFLPADRRGVFVVEPTRDEPRLRDLAGRHWRDWVCVTYLRLEASQRTLVDRLWPAAGSPVPAEEPPRASGADFESVAGRQHARDLLRIALSSSGSWVTARDLAAQVGVKLKRCNLVLGEMRGAGEVECLVGPETHWRLRPGET